MKKTIIVSNAMRFALNCTAAVVFLLAAFGGVAGAQFDLTVKMTAFTPTHEGELFKLRVVNSVNGQELGEYVNEGITTADFTAVFYNILKSDESYHIDAFADFNDNKLYDPPSLDHAWRIILTGVTGDTTITLKHSAQWTDIKYPNPGEQPVPEPADSCGCDLNGDGAADNGDLLEWIAQVRGGADNPCLDYDRDGNLALDDLIRLLVDIRAGGCVVD